MKYKCDVEKRHSYNLLVIRPLISNPADQSHAFDVIGTLRFTEDVTGNEALEKWKTLVEKLEI